MPFEDFIDNQEEQSEAKCALIDTFYVAWAQVMKNSYSENVTFLDLFAGPGRHGNGKTSAPILVLDEAVSDAQMREMLITGFNDKDLINIRALKESIDTIPDIERLRHSPRYYNFETDNELLTALNQIPLNPCLSFVDLWGFKNLTIDIINTLVAGVWGCDCFLFFDYSHIKSGFSNPLVSRYINALFGEERAGEIKSKVAGMNPNYRELYIANALGEMLEESVGKYIIPFRFCGNDGQPTSQFIYFVSKHYHGYDLLKEIISIETNIAGPYVKRFQYTSTGDKQLSLLYGFTPNKEPLCSQLLKAFAGQFLSMRSVYSKHNRRTSYTKKDYQNALLELELRGAITCNPAQRRQHTMADNVMITFPPLP